MVVDYIFKKIRFNFDLHRAMTYMTLKLHRSSSSTYIYQVYYLYLCILYDRRVRSRFRRRVWMGGFQFALQIAKMSRWKLEDVNKTAHKPVGVTLTPLKQDR